MIEFLVHVPSVIFFTLIKLAFLLQALVELCVIGIKIIKHN